MKIKALILGLFVFAFAATAHAQDTTPRTVKKYELKKYKANQKTAKTKMLSRKQAQHKYHKRQKRKVVYGKKIAKADGKISRGERAIIKKHKRKAVNSKMVLKKKYRRTHKGK